MLSFFLPPSPKDNPRISTTRASSLHLSLIAAHEGGLRSKVQQTVPASFATLDLAIDDHDSLYIPGLFFMFLLFLHAVV